MTLSSIRPFGLRDVRITDLDGANPVDLPAATTLRFTERIASEDFVAEGVQVGAASFTERVDWDIEAGGIDIAVYVKLTGHTGVGQGTTPARIVTMTAMSGDEFPYVRIYGQALGDNGDDIHCKIYKAKLTDLSGDFRDGQFFITRCAGVGVKDGTRGAYQFIQHETKTSL